MVNKINTNEIQTMIYDTLKDRYENIEVKKVHVSEDVDFDGDAILNIVVVFKAQPQTKVNIIGNAITTVREKLFQKDIFEFPFMSFMSENDAKTYDF